MQPSQILLAQDTVHNPDEPRHFMKIKPVTRRVRVSRDGVLLAETERALRVLEVGRDFYDPVFYIPRQDVTAELAPVSGKTSHCPIKGDASYFRLASRSDDGPVAWSYEKPIAGSRTISGHIAFDADQVTIEETGEDRPEKG